MSTPIATGIAKRLIIKKETTPGVLAGAAGGQTLRRQTSTLSYKPDTYQSNEIRTDYQVADYRYGTRRVTGDISGELSPATYGDLLAAALRYNWTAGVSVTQADVTSVTTTTNSIVAASGSFIAKGLKVGDVIKTIGLPDAANNGKRLRITGLTASTVTTAETLVANSTPSTSFTIQVQGKKLLVPSTGHTSDSFTMEHYYSDIGTTEVFTGVKVNQIDIGLPATGMATFKSSLIGLDMTTDPNGDGSAPYFTAPAAETVTPLLTAVGGNLRVAGSDVATVTGITLTIAGNITGDPVVGRNVLPQLFPGRVVVTGQLTAYYTDGSLARDLQNETEISLSSLLDTGNANGDFMSIVINRLKIGGADKDDGEKGLIQTVPFQALLNQAGGPGSAFDLTTISIQDSMVA